MNSTATRNGKPKRPSPELLDKKLPGDPEIERMLLGSIILDPRRLEEITPIIHREDFGEDRHKLLWDHLTAAPPNVAGDVALLPRWLAGVGDLEEIGGTAYIGEVMGAPPHVANAKHYAEVVRGLAIRRRAVQTAEFVLQAGHDPTIDAATLQVRAAELLQGGDHKPTEAPAFTNLLTGGDLLALDLKPRFLVRGVLVEGQPMIVGGRSKTLKTSIACDLALSLGSGSPFLGKFDTHRVNVGYWSGESGAVTMRETAQRQAAAKGIDLADCSVFWSFDLPKLCHLDHLDHFAQTIGKYKLRVAIVDPLYLSLLNADTAGQAANLFAMGAALQPLSKLAQEAGVTLIVLHHFRKGGQPNEDEPAGLEELTMSGAAEWARQWLLLQRRVAYQGDGNHLLWMRCGGSAGHSSLWGVTIDEGVIDPDTFTGRTWEVTVAPAADARAEAKAEQENRKAADQERREGEHRDRLLAVLRTMPEGNTERALSKAARLNPDNFFRAISALLQEGRVATCKVIKNGASYDGFRPTGK
jgi:hypothetical protein